MLAEPPWEVPPPAGGDTYLGGVINGFTIAILVIDIIVVGLRVATRIWLTESKFWWDDGFIVAALLATTIGTALDAVEVHYGFGRPEHYITIHELQMFEEYAYCEWVQTFFTLMCTKVSICFFLLRLPASRNFIWPLYVSIAILIVSNTVITFLWIFQCNPVDAVWTYGVSGNCFSHTQLLDIIFAQAIISCVSDFGLAFYPFLVLRNLKLTRQQKLGLVVLMGLGVITGACCVVRTVLNGESLPTDATYGGIDNWFWRLFEVNLGIICACIPTLVPFYRWTRKYIFPNKGSPLRSMVFTGKSTDYYGKSTTEKDSNDSKYSKYSKDTTLRQPDTTTTNQASANRDTDTSFTERVALGRLHRDLSTQNARSSDDSEMEIDLESGVERSESTSASPSRQPSVDRLAVAPFVVMSLASESETESQHESSSGWKALRDRVHRPHLAEQRQERSYVRSPLPTTTSATATFSGANSPRRSLEIQSDTEEGRAVIDGARIGVTTEVTSYREDISPGPHSTHHPSR